MGKIKKIGFVFLLVFSVSCLLFGSYHYARSRRYNLRVRECEELTERIKEENNRLNNELSSIRDGIKKLSADASELDDLNGKAISGLEDAIERLREVRNKINVLENNYNNIVNSVGNENTN